MAGQAKQTKTSISIGLRIKFAREKRKLSAKDFSKIMEIAAQTISYWEAGRSAFPAHQLMLIAKKLGVSPAWLLTGEGEMETGKKNLSP